MPSNTIKRAEEIFARAIAAPPPQRGRLIEEACQSDAALREEVERFLAAHSGAEDEGFLREPTAHGDPPPDESQNAKRKRVVAEPGESAALAAVQRDFGDAAVAPISEQPGSRIGQYKLLQKIGEGGFGVVYMADQEEPIRRRVALKIIKLGMDTRGVIARFEAERQALAMMDHPNIARVLDAGATDAGRPYFVMDLVRGIPLTDFCDRNNLTLEQRLALFADVCHAVQHAHQKGIIHRDLKPSNVLVTMHDDRAVPKVIDFGIAKATHQRLTDKTLFTAFAQFIGTPAYMSPEQAQLSGLDIDTRSDVYSLGVLLYELLTGTTPFDADRLLSGGYAEMQRIIKEVEPPRPSTRVSTLREMEAEREPARANRQSQRPASDAASSEMRIDTDAATLVETGGRGSAAAPGGRGSRRAASSADAQDFRTSARSSQITDIARHRRTDPHSLVRTIRGDLDWIVMKCIEKDRTRRYETATALAADVGRFLRNEPVEASPPSTVYRLRKLVRRRRGAVLAVTALAASLVLGVIGTTAGLVRALHAEEAARSEADAARKAREIAVAQQARAEANEQLARDEADRADEEAARARSEAAKSQTVFAFLRNMLSPGGEGTRGDPNVTLRELVDIAAQELATHANTYEPEVEAAIRDTIGQTYLSLGQYAEAEPFLKEALSIRQEVLGPDSADAAASMENVASWLQATGQLAAARTMLEDALAIQRRVLGEENPDVAMTLNNLGNLLYLQGDFDAAVEALQTALAMRRKLLPPDHPHIATSLSSLGGLYQMKGDLRSAEPLLNEALAMRRRLLGESHPQVAITLNNLASLTAQKGDYAAAETYYREALAANRKLYGDKHPQVVIAMNNLGYLLHAVGKYDDAVALLREALAVRRELLGDEHPDVALSMYNLAAALRSQRDFDAAEPLMREALAMRRRLLGDDHPDLAQSLTGMAALLKDKGESDGVEPLVREALDIYRRRLGDDHPQVAYCLHALATIMMDRGEDAAAEPLFRQALQIMQDRLGPDHPTVATLLYDLGGLLVKTGRWSETLPLLEQAVSIRRQRLGETHPETRKAVAQLEKLRAKIAERNADERE